MAYKSWNHWVSKFLFWDTPILSPLSFFCGGVGQKPSIQITPVSHQTRSCSLRSSAKNWSKRLGSPAPFSSVPFWRQKCPKFNQLYLGPIDWSLQITKKTIRKQLSHWSCFTVSSHWNDRNILNTCHPETFSDIQWPTLQDSKPNTIPHPLTRPRCGKKVSHPQKTVALLLQDVGIFTEGHQLKLFFFCGGAMV